MTKRSQEILSTLEVIDQLTKDMTTREALATLTTALSICAARAGLGRGSIYSVLADDDAWEAAEQLAVTLRKAGR